MMDLALTVAENAWLLMLVPILAGAIAYGASSLMPKTYESTAVLQPAPSVPVQVGDSTVMPSAAVVANTLATTITTSAFLERARQKVAQNGDAAMAPTAFEDRKPSDIVRATVGSNDHILTLTVSWHTPIGAQQLASAILELAREDSRPKASELQRLNTERANLGQQIGELTLTGQKVQSMMELDGATPQLDKLAKTHFLIASNLLEMRRRVNEIDTRLDGMSEESIVQRPSLPSEPVAPRKLIIALVTAIGVGFVLLIGIFVRQSWRVSGHSANNHARLQALKRKYGFQQRA